MRQSVLSIQLAMTIRVGRYELLRFDGVTWPHGVLLHGRPIMPFLADLVDRVSRYVDVPVDQE
eukprot:23955-Eustigmatos_ZCMA.PRE.1